MKKLFITLALLSTTAYLAAGHNTHENGDKKQFGSDIPSWQKSPEEMAQLIKHLKKQTFRQSPELLKKWNDFRADAIKIVAKEVARQVIPQIDSPIMRAKYKNLVKTMMKLVHQFRNLPIPERPFKISLDNLPLLLALKGRMMALKALQLMTVAEQTGTKALLKKAQFKLKLAEKIKKALQLLDQSAYGYDKKAGMKFDMYNSMYNGIHYDNGTGYTGEPMYIIIEEEL